MPKGIFNPGSFVPGLIGGRERLGPSVPVGVMSIEEALEQHRGGLAIDLDSAMGGETKTGIIKPDVDPKAPKQ